MIKVCKFCSKSKWESEKLNVKIFCYPTCTHLRDIVCDWRTNAIYSICTTFANNVTSNERTRDTEIVTSIFQTPFRILKPILTYSQL